MSDYKLIIFDWEGTLNNGLGQVLQAFTTAATTLDLPKVDEALIRTHLGLEIWRLLDLIYPNLEAAIKQNFIEQYHRNILGSKRCALLFKGVRQLLMRLNDEQRLLAILTCKGRAALDKDLEMLALKNVFFTTKTPHECAAKPCPDGIIHIMNETGIDRAETLMVGDSPSDMAAAIAAGVDGIGVDFMNAGLTTRLMSAGAKTVFTTVDEIEAYLA